MFRIVFWTLAVVAIGLVAMGAINTTMFQQKEIVGMVTPVPTRHFRGSPTKDWPVTKIHVKIGSQVKAGDCLVELDPAMRPQEKAKADLDAATEHLNVVRSCLVIREKMLNRCQRLLEKQAASQEDNDERTEKVNALRCELAEAEAHKRAAEASLGSVKYDYDYYQRIISPISGEVVAINCSLGLVARPENRQLVWVEVIDGSIVHICCFVSPKLGPRLRELMNDGTMICIADTNCLAKVVAIPKILVSGKLKVILEVGNEDLELTCGQEVKINIP